MNKYRVTAQANGKEVIEELEAVSADVAWTIIDEKYNWRLHDGLVEELPTREEQAATIAQLREALEPFVSAYNENGGCVPITEDDREEMLYSIFNVISLDDFTRAACVLKGGE